MDRWLVKSISLLLKTMGELQKEVIHILYTYYSNIIHILLFRIHFKDKLCLLKKWNASTKSFVIMLFLNINSINYICVLVQEGKKTHERCSKWVSQQ